MTTDVVWAWKCEKAVSSVGLDLKMARLRLLHTGWCSFPTWISMISNSPNDFLQTGPGFRPISGRIGWKIPTREVVVGHFTVPSSINTLMAWLFQRATHCFLHFFLSIDVCLSWVKKNGNNGGVYRFVGPGRFRLNELKSVVFEFVSWMWLFSRGPATCLRWCVRPDALPLASFLPSWVVWFLWWCSVAMV